MSDGQFCISTLNKISPAGLRSLPRENYLIDSGCDPQGILVRSCDMKEMDLPESLLAIARAGSGVNNIPLDRCTDRGIAVFNTPGANANGVRELALLGIFMAYRRIQPALEWVQSLKGEGSNIPGIIEKDKARFTGRDVRGNRLGVIGLGKIGALVAESAIALGMDVAGYDPYLSVPAAWGIPDATTRIDSLEELLDWAEVISIHVPLSAETRGLLGREQFERARSGLKVINLSRGGVVDSAAVLEAIETGNLECYVTDFPEDSLLGVPGVVVIPHLGASTVESSERCAVMAAEALSGYLERGDVVNSVNFPNCQLSEDGYEERLCLLWTGGEENYEQVVREVEKGGNKITRYAVSREGGLSYAILCLRDSLSGEVFERIKEMDRIKLVRHVVPPVEESVR